VYSAKVDKGNGMVCDQSVALNSENAVKTKVWCVLQPDDLQIQPAPISNQLILFEFLPDSSEFS